MKKWLYRIILMALTAVIFCSGYQIWKIVSEYRAGTRTYDDMKQFIQGSEEETPDNIIRVIQETTSEEEPTFAAPQTEDGGFSVDFESLLEFNSDVVGWIYIEDTNVNYPILRGEDNIYYLRHMINHEYNVTGSIYMDYRCAGDFSDSQTIIYGHYVKNGTMFTDVDKYKDPVYAYAHPEAVILTPSGNYRIRFFAGYKSDVNTDAWATGMEGEALQEWIDEAISKSAFQSELHPTSADRIITLSTCDLEDEELDLRFVLLGVLEELN